MKISAFGKSALLALAIMTMFGSEAFAQGTEELFQPVSSAATSVLNFMTGTFASTCATIAVAYFGYQTLQGHMAINRGITIIVGIVIIFGAAHIVKAFQSSSGGGMGMGMNDRPAIIMPA